MRIFKAIIIVAFTTFMMLGFFDFDINALWEAAADSPFMFAFATIATGLLGFVAVNKFNTSDY